MRFYDSHTHKIQLTCRLLTTTFLNPFGSINLVDLAEP